MNNTTGSNNTAVGINALSNSTVSESNVAVGTNSQVQTTTGTRNTSVGVEALGGKQNLGQALTGNDNIAVGYQALYLNTAGNHNIAVGNNALANATGSYRNTAIGNSALFSMTDGAAITYPGEYYKGQNVAVGYESLKFSDGGFNTAIGVQALAGAATIGIGNSNIGAPASLSKAAYNVAIGYRAGVTIRNGIGNILIGSIDEISPQIMDGNRNIIIGGQINAGGVDRNGDGQLAIGNYIYGSNGNLGLGKGILAQLTSGRFTREPSTVLDIDNGTNNGAIRIVDGTQGTGKVLTSDANGVGTWQNPSGNNITIEELPFDGTSHRLTTHLKPGIYKYEIFDGRCSGYGNVVFKRNGIDQIYHTNDNVNPKAGILRILSETDVLSMTMNIRTCSGPPTVEGGAPLVVFTQLPPLLLPNPEDCSSYFEKIDVPVLKYCPDGLHFNPKCDCCDSPQNAGCEDY
ncbi:MAG: hypothetical protein LBR75_05035 [Prevotellaceae bacterium]|jgi:hypothetical protein|nr:hypothetical protein [Prevotellaceae bacterium]